MAIPKDPVVQFFDDQADLFDTFAEQSFTWRHVERPAYQALIRRLAPASLRALDLGSGSGRIVKLLLEEGVLADSIVGVDASEKLLAIARPRYPGVAFIQQDVRELSLGSDFTLATSHMLLQVLDNESRRCMLRKVYQQLASGGTLFFMTTHPLRQVQGMPPEEYLRLRSVDINTPWGKPGLNVYAPLMDYLNATADAGFRIELVQELGLPEGARDEPEYAKYAPFAALRLAVTARK